MTSRVRPHGHHDWVALEVLRHMAITERGWRYRGVRGWMLSQEAEAEIRRPLRAVLGRLSADGHVLRVDVRPPGQRQSLWLHRITEVGLRSVERRRGMPARTLSADRDDPVDRGVFFLSRRRWDALQALQAARMEPQASQSIIVSGRALPHEEVRWLVASGLVERHPDADAAPPRAYRYIASELGMRVRTAAPPTPAWVQLRLHDAPPSAQPCACAAAPFLSSHEKNHEP